MTQDNDNTDPESTAYQEARRNHRRMLAGFTGVHLTISVGCYVGYVVDVKTGLLAAGLLSFALMVFLTILTNALTGDEASRNLLERFRDLPPSEEEI